MNPAVPGRIPHIEMMSGDTDQRAKGIGEVQTQAAQIEIVRFERRHVVAEPGDHEQILEQTTGVRAHRGRCGRQWLPQRVRHRRRNSIDSGARCCASLKRNQVVLAG